MMWNESRHFQVCIIVLMMMMIHIVHGQAQQHLTLYMEEADFSISLFNGTIPMLNKENVTVLDESTPFLNLKSKVAAMFFSESMGLQLIYDTSSWRSPGATIAWSSNPQDNFYGSLDGTGPYTIVDSCAGPDHAMFFISEGGNDIKLYGYGDNTNYRLGLDTETIYPTTSIDEYLPKDAIEYYYPSGPLEKLTCGRKNTYITDAYGHIVGVGEANNLQFGFTTSTDSSWKVLSFTDGYINSNQQLSCTDHCALLSNERLLVWGPNEYNQLSLVDTADKSYTEILPSEIGMGKFLQVATTKGSLFVLYEDSSPSLYVSGIAKAQFDDDPTNLFVYAFYPSSASMDLFEGEQLTGIRTISNAPETNLYVYLNYNETNATPIGGTPDDEYPYYAYKLNSWSPHAPPLMAPKRTWGSSYAFVLYENPTQCGNIPGFRKDSCGPHGSCYDGSCICRGGYHPSQNGQQCIGQCPFSCPPNLICKGFDKCGPKGNKETNSDLNTESHLTPGFTYQSRAEISGEIRDKVSAIANFHGYLYTLRGMRNIVGSSYTMGSSDQNCGTGETFCTYNTESFEINQVFEPIAMCTGKNHMAILNSQKRVYLWGNDMNGYTLGSAFSNDLLSPTENAEFYMSYNFMNVFCARYTTFFLSRDDNNYDKAILYGFGENAGGILGSDPISYPYYHDYQLHYLEHDTMSEMISFSCQYTHCIYSTNYEVIGWGNNADFQLSSYLPPSVYVPSSLYNHTHPIIKVASGFHVSGILAEDGIYFSGPASALDAPYDWEFFGANNNTIGFSVMVDTFFILQDSETDPNAISYYLFGNQTDVKNTPSNVETKKWDQKLMVLMSDNNYDYISVMDFVPSNRANFTEQQSGIAICHNKTGKEACGPKGICVGWNSCYCLEGYEGPECRQYGDGDGSGSGPGSGWGSGSGGACRMDDQQDPDIPCPEERTGQCYGVDWDDQNVCAGNGTCNPPYCSCYDQSVLRSPACQLIEEFTCFSVFATNPSVCSGNGYCIGDGICDCEIGFSGENCQNAVPVCNGLDGEEACEYNGFCSNGNVCSCYGNATGSYCEIFSCQSGFCVNGECSGPNKCSCDIGFVGDRCDIPMPHIRNAGRMLFSSYGHQSIFWDITSSLIGFFEDREYGSFTHYPVSYAVSEHSLLFTTNIGEVFFMGGYADFDVNGDLIDVFPTPWYNNIRFEYPRSMVRESHLNTENEIIVDIAMGSNHALLLNDFGNVYAFGSDLDSNGVVGSVGKGFITKNPSFLWTGITDKIIRVYAGTKTSFFLTEKRFLYSVGDNSQNAVGRISNTDSIDFVIDKVKAFSCSYESCLALDYEPGINVWGLNDFGQLGVGHATNVQSPVFVPVSDDVISKLATGKHHTLFLQQGVIFVSGKGTSFSGGGSNTFISLPFNELIDDIGAGMEFTMFKYYDSVKGEYMVVSFGKQAVGELGQGIPGNVVLQQNHTQIAYKNMGTRLGFLDGSYESMLIYDEIPCFGYPPSNINVCSGNGLCLGRDRCKCDPNYSGDQCEFFNTTTNNCGSFGIQVGNGLCLCSDNSFTADTPCPAPQCPANCNSQGTCNNGVCTCYNSMAGGHFNGTDCSDCQSGWFGPECKVKVALEFESFDVISGYFFTSAISSITCDDIFPPDILFELGDFPICEWTSDHAGYGFKVTLGEFASITPRQIEVYPYPYSSTTIALELKTLNSSTKPTAVVSGSSLVGSCSSAYLDGSYSYSDDGRFLEYVWTLDNPSGISDMDNYLVNSPYSYLMIPDSVFTQYGVFTFKLVVKSPFGGESDPAYFAITRSSVSLPSLDIYPLDTYITRSDEAYLSAYGYSCSNKPFRIDWYPLNHNISGQAYYNGSNYVIQPNSFPIASETTYKFMVICEYLDNSGSVNQTVSVTVGPSPISAVITGGDRVVSMSKRVILDASQSYDPDPTSGTKVYTWTCHGGINICPTLPSSTDILELPANSFTSPGFYYFDLEIQKGSQSVFAYTYLEIVSYNPPSLYLYPLPEVSIRSQEIFVSAILDGDDFSLDETYQWNATVNGTAVDLESIAFTNLDRRELGIYANSFPYNSTVKFTLTAINSNGAATASVQTRMNNPLVMGNVAISPNTGTLFETEFTMSITANQNYKYVYGYYDGEFQVYMNSPTSSNRYSFYLPYSGNITLFVEAYDKYGGSGIKKIIATVNEPSSDLFDIAANITDTLSVDNIDKLYATATNIGIMFEKEFESITLGSSGCPNDCSGNGECFESICYCDEGFYKADCSVSEQQQQKRIALKENLFNKVYEAQSSSISTTFNDQIFQQQATLMESMTKTSDEMSDKATELATDFIDKMFNSSQTKGVAISEKSSETIGKALSNVLKAVFGTTKTNTEAGKTKASSTAAKMRKSMDSLANSLRQRVATGSTKQVKLEKMTIISGKVDVKDLNKASVGSSDGKVKIKLSPDILTQGNYTNSAQKGNGLEVSIISLSINPYISANGSDTIKSDIVQVDFSISGSKIIVRNLNNPISITVPGSYNITTDETKPGFRAFCSFWNETLSSFSTAGCVVGNSTKNETLCMCNHATDFASFLSYIVPNLNILTANDLTLITKLDQDNFATLFVMLGLALTYCLCMVFLEMLQLTCNWCMNIVRHKETQKKVNPDDSHTKGIIRPILERFKRAHIWISFFYTPNSEPNFTRSRRLTVLYMIIIGIMGTNALTFGQKQENELQMIASIIICDLIVTPPILICTFLFGKIRSTSNPKHKQKNIAESEIKWNEMMEESNSDSNSIHSEASEVSSKNQVVPDTQVESIEEENDSETKEDEYKEEVIFSDMPLYEDESISEPKKIAPAPKKEDPWDLMGNEVVVQSVVTPTQEVQASPWKQLDRRNSSAIEQFHKVNRSDVYEAHAFDADDEYNELQGKDMSIEEMRVLDLYHYKTGDILDKVDQFLIGLKKHFDYHTRTVTVVSIFLFIIASLLWFALVGLAAWLSTNIYWITRVGIASMCTGGIVLYVMALEFLIINAKRNSFQNNPRMKWVSRMSRNIQIVICILLIVLMIVIEGLLTLTAGKTIYSFDYDIGIENMIIIQIGILAFVACDILWIFLLLRPPKRKTKNEISRVSRFGITWFPEFFKFPLYFMCLSWIGAASYLLVIYGIKFSEIEKGSDIKWMISSFTSLGQNVFLNKPATFVLRAFVFIMVMNLFEDLFFKTISRRRAQQPTDQA